MALDPPLYTVEQYRELAEAYASGELEVKYQDKEVKYRSLVEMERIMRRMEAYLGLSACTGGRTVGVYNKGA